MNRTLYYLYQPYKWLVYIPVLIVSTFIFGTLAILLSYIDKKLSSLIGGAWWARVNAFFTPMFVRVKGRENIKKKQSYVIVANHQSLFDIFVLYGWIGVDIRWVMKYELRKVPVLGYACKRVGHIFVNRSNTKESLKSIEKAKASISGGSSVIFFPEGTRSRDGSLNRFKKGAFRLAQELQLPILPVTLKGTRHILPYGGIDLKPGRVQMIIDRPIDIAKYPEERLDQLMQDARDAIEQNLLKPA